MSKQLVYQAMCDMCDEQSYVPIGELESSADILIDFPITIGDEAVEVDLCKNHRDLLIDAVTDFLAVGHLPTVIRTTAKPKKAKKVAILEPVIAPDHFLLPTHTTPRKSGRPASPSPCPDCDFVGQSPQGLGAHRHHTHGYVSPKNIK